LWRSRRNQCKAEYEVDQEEKDVKMRRVGMVMDIQEKDKNQSQNDKTEHENGKSVKEKSSRSQKLKSNQVKVNPGKWIWKEHQKPNPKT
ncbi:hypothetical protein Tco_0167150, partial [Tanacetum coccineum]